MVKALDSQWRINDRSNSWVKLKPDYVSQVGGLCCLHWVALLPRLPRLLVLPVLPAAHTFHSHSPSHSPAQLSLLVPSLNHLSH